MLPTDLTVGALVERDGRFLIIEERCSLGLVITQPGGHIEHGESPETAVERETLEEAACKIAARELLGVYLWIHPQTRQQFLKIMFIADLLEEYRGRALDSGIEAVHWYTAADLRRRSREIRTPVVLRCIDDYQAGTRQDSNILQQMAPLQQHVPAMLANAALV